MTQSNLITLTPEQLRELLVLALQPVYDRLSALSDEMTVLRQSLADEQAGRATGWKLGRRMLQEQMASKSDDDVFKPPVIPARRKD